MHVKENEILEAALLGYQSQIGDLQDKMREIEARLSPAPEIVAWDATPVTITRHRPQRLPKPKRRTMSAEGRARIAAAQKKRWRLLKRAAA